MFTIRIVENESILEEYQEYLKANNLCAKDEYKIYSVDGKMFLINQGGTSWKWIPCSVCEPVTNI